MSTLFVALTALLSSLLPSANALSIHPDALRPSMLVEERAERGTPITLRVRNDGSATFYVYDRSMCAPAFFVDDAHGHEVAAFEPVPCILLLPPPIEVHPGATVDLGSWDQHRWRCDDDGVCSGTQAEDGLYEIRIRLSATKHEDGVFLDARARVWIGDQTGRRFVTVRGMELPAALQPGDRPIAIVELTPPAGTRYEGAVVMTRSESIHCFRAPCYAPKLVTIVPYALTHANASGATERVAVDLGPVTAGLYTVRVLGRTDERTTTITVGESGGFADVPSTHWARAYIDLLALRGVLRGHDDGNFRPQWNITRAEIAKVALLSSGSGVLTGLPNPYADLPATHSLKDALLTALSRGDLADDRPFARPDRPATRYETLKALMDAFGRAPTPTLQPLAPAFPDAVEGAPAAYSSEAARTGIISGNDGRFLPNDPITRAEVAKIVYGLLTR